MPCRDLDADNRYIAELQGKVQRLTGLLCEACGLLDRADGGEYQSWLGVSDELHGWWLAHLDADRARKAEEQAQAQRKALYEGALAKLSDEERRILGLKP
jgi:hypothetical protein